MTTNPRNPDYEIERFRVFRGEDLRITHTVCGSTDPVCFLDGDGTAWCTFCDDVDLCERCGDWPVTKPTRKNWRGGECRCQKEER